MKKNIFTVLLGGLIALVLTTPVFAATTVSLSPTSVNVVEGRNFVLTVKIDPQGLKNYTAKMELTYPTNLLKVNSFTFGTSWMPVSQPGYDLINNVNGTLIKTAGYPGGVSSAVTFGTVSFLAKKSGNGMITLNSGNSLALDANNQNLLAGAVVQTAVAISAPTPTPTTPTEEPTKEEPVLEEEESPVVTEEPITEPQPIERSFLASVGSVVTLGTNSIIVGLLVTIAILVLAGYAIYAMIQRARRKNLGKLR